MFWLTNFRKLLAVLATAALVAGVSGCPADDTQTAARNPAGGDQQRERPSKPKPDKEKAETDTAKTEAEEYRYDPTDKWDPFDVPPPPVMDNLTPESRYDLDQMVLKGIVRGSGMDGAFIRFPDGSDIIVRVGDHLGKHRGIVKEIAENYIVVEERYLSPTQPNDTFIIEKVLELPKK